MTETQYNALQETLQGVLANQQAINDNLTAFKTEVELKLLTLEGEMTLRRTHEQLADAHHDIVREEARQIKALLINEVLPGIKLFKKP
jgi:hypothetical protein